MIPMIILVILFVMFWTKILTYCTIDYLCFFFTKIWLADLNLMRGQPSLGSPAVDGFSNISAISNYLQSNVVDKFLCLW